MTEQNIVDLIRQYEYVPKAIIEKLLCADEKNISYLERKLRYLSENRCIEYLKNEDATVFLFFQARSIRTD